MAVQLQELDICRSWVSPVTVTAIQPTKKLRLSSQHLSFSTYLNTRLCILKSDPPLCKNVCLLPRTASSPPADQHSWDGAERRLIADTLMQLSPLEGSQSHASTRDTAGLTQ